jgi:hypothetical protein
MSDDYDQRLMEQGALKTWERLSPQQQQEMKSIVLQEKNAISSMRGLERYQKWIETHPNDAVFWLIKYEMQGDTKVVTKVHGIHVLALLRQQTHLYQTRNIAPFNRQTQAKTWPFAAALCQIVYFMWAIPNHILDHVKLLSPKIQNDKPKTGKAVDLQRSIVNTDKPIVSSDGKGGINTATCADATNSDVEVDPGLIWFDYPRVFSPTSPDIHEQQLKFSFCQDADSLYLFYRKIVNNLLNDWKFSAQSNFWSYFSPGPLPPQPQGLDQIPFCICKETKEELFVGKRKIRGKKAIPQVPIPQVQVPQVFIP